MCIGHCFVLGTRLSTGLNAKPNFGEARLWLAVETTVLYYSINTKLKIQSVTFKRPETVLSGSRPSTWGMKARHSVLHNVCAELKLEAYY